MAVNLSPLAGAGWQFFDNNGVPLAAGLLYTYAAGTSTPQATYTTSSGSIANSNPIVLDAAGRVSTEIWLTAGQSYKFVLQNYAAVQIWSFDNISGVNDFSSATATNLTVTGTLTASGTITGSAFSNYFAAPPVIGGTTPANGTFTNLIATVGATVPTAGIFDNSTAAATTAFVQRALGNASTVLFPTATTTLTTSAAGALIYCLPVSATTLTLPASSSIVLGTTIKFVNIYSPLVTIQAPGSDKIYFVGYSSPVNPVLNVNDTATLVWTGGNWTITEGSIEWKYQTDKYGSVLSGNGYQKLPSGLIVQWGTVVSSGTGTSNAVVTYPIPFPNITFQTYATCAGSPTTGSYTVLSSTNSVSGATFTVLVNGSGVSSVAINWLALGY
jgi:hypothetical protein